MKSPPPFSTSRCDVGVTPHGPGGKADVEEAVREIFTPPPFFDFGMRRGGGHLRPLQPELGVGVMLPSGWRT